MACIVPIWCVLNQLICPKTDTRAVLMRAPPALRAGSLVCCLALSLFLSSLPVASALCPSGPFNQTSCTAALPVTPSPVCVPANATAVLQLLQKYPSCAPLLDQADALGDGIWLPVDPVTNITAWAVYNVALSQVATGYNSARPAPPSPSFLLISSIEDL